MAWVEFNERLSNARLIRRVGNEAFGVWVRCLLLAAEQEHVDYRISEQTVLEFGHPGVLALLTEGSESFSSLLELVEGLDPEQWPGRWYKARNWQVGSSFRPAWVIHRTRSAIPDELRYRVYERDGFRCIRCGTDQDLTLDHVHPHSKGGADTFDNLRTLCQPCNSAKRDRAE